MRPYAPLCVKKNIQAYHCFFTYLDVPFAIVIELRIVVEASLYSLVPILALSPVLVLHHVLGRKRNYLLETYDEDIWKVVLVKWEEPLRDVDVFQGFDAT